MADEVWELVPLGEVITLQRGFDLPASQRQPGKIPVVSSSGIMFTHSEAAVKAPGVVTGRYGTIGQVFYITEDYWPLNTTLFVKDFKGNDPRFISYLLQTLDFASYSDKSSVPGVNRNHLHLAEVARPPLSEQRAIAHILGTLDDKIELNRRMNATLESMARALFKAWFVDFEPVRAKARRGDRPVAPTPPAPTPGLPPHLAELFPARLVDSELGEVPEGWEMKPLDQIADFLNGLALQKYPPNGEESLPVIKIAQMRKGNAEGADRASDAIDPAYIVNDGDVLFSWSGSLEAMIWCGDRGALNQHLFKVTSADYPKWFYYHWVLTHLPDFQEVAAGKATTMGHIQRHHLAEAKVVVPLTGLLEEMSKHFAPLLDRFVANQLESRTLAALRDALLPRLVSGELRVKDVEKFIAG